MKILIAAIHYPIASGRYIARAFRRLGHDVKTIGPFTGLNIWGSHVNEGMEWMPNIWVDRAAFPDFVSTGFMELCQDHFHLDQSWKPDLIISADSGYGFTWEDSAVPHVVYGVDNHVRDYHLGVDYDHLFLAHSTGHRIGDDNVTHLPCGYDPEWHTVTTGWIDRPYDAAMIGVVYPPRYELLTALGETGIIIHAATGLIMQDYSEAYNNAKISVCKSVNGDMAQRIFETAAMGCLILSDECHDFAALGFEAWKHYIPYKTPQEAVQNVLEVLRNWDQDAIDKMLTRTMEWVKPHTWDARCRVILDTMEAMSQ